MGKEAINEINDSSMKIPKGISNEINDRSMRSKTASQTDYIADKLVKIYQAPQSRDFFLKCAWRLSENTIWTAVEASQRRKIRQPVKYFVKTCNNAINDKIAHKSGY